ncbi:hypothetical protein DENSPDRAFT_845177 [Dentipellis sp. KUC8613]|nr:hypothetical protein DENSPDRAFT_845177 [Dentipellis sp. KUC8613]
MHALVHSPAFIARSLRDAPADVPPPFTLTLDTQYPYMSSFRSEANCDSVLPLSVSSPGSTPASAPTLASGLFTAPAALEAHFLEADSRTDILRLSALALLRKHKFSTTRSCAVQADYDAELPSFSYSFVLESDSEASVANMLLPQEPGLLSVGLGVDAGNEAIAVDVSSEATAKAASETTLATSRDDASDTKIMVIEEPEDSEDFSGQFDDAEPSNETQESSFSTLDSFGPTTPFTQRILPAPSASASSIISLTPAWPKSPLLGSASTFSIRRSLDFAALYRSKAWLGRKRPTQDEPGPGSGKDAFRASGFSASFTR